MKHFSLFFLLLMIPIHTLVADSPVRPEENSINKGKLATPTTNQPLTISKAKKSKLANSKRFVPSEKISADVAVSFPADI